MANEQLKAEARAGQPKALEALMNQALGKQGITVRVIKSGDLLKITLRSNSIPDQKMVDLVKKGIASINPDGVTKVALRGEQVKGKNAWTTEWDLSDPKTTSAPCLATKSKSKWYFHPAVIVGGATAAFILFISTSTLVDPPAPPPPKPSPIYPSREPTELDIFQTTLEMNTPGILAKGMIKDMNLVALKQRCPSLIAATSDAGINTAISMLSSELRLRNGYDEKLAGNLATGLVEGCAAWVRGDRINPGRIEDRSKPPLNELQIDQWEREYGDE